MRDVSPDPDPLSLLADAAGALPVPEAEPDALDELVRAATVAARGRARRRETTRAWLLAACALLAVGVGAWLYQRPAVERVPLAPRDAAPGFVTLDLPTGDRVTRAGEGEIGLEAASPDARVFRLGAGEMLFDVAPLGPGQRFEVHTPHISAHVVGTVFAVAVEDAVTRVRVYEGRVEIRRDGEVLTVAEPGMSFRSDGADASTWRPSLEERGWTAARRRAGALRVEPPAQEPVATAESADRPAPGLPTPSRLLPSGPSPSGLSPSGPPPSARARAESTSEAPQPSAPDLASARAWLAAGEAARARSAADRVLAAQPREAEWWLLRGDAARTLQRWEDAVQSYERAAELLPPSRATSAGYLAAELRLQRLEDPAGSLQTLARTGAGRPGSPLEERATVLAIRAHLAADDAAAARREARRYLLRFPAGASTDWARSVAEPR